MKKSKAKKLIKELQNEINDLNVKEQFWMDKCYAYIQAIFGNETQSIALPMFNTYYLDRRYNTMDVEDRKKRLEELFKSYLVMIDNGVVLQRNYLQNYTDPQIFLSLIGIIVAIGALFYSIGLNIGESREKCNSSRFEQFKYKKYRNEERCTHTQNMHPCKKWESVDMITDTSKNEKKK